MNVEPRKSKMKVEIFGFPVAAVLLLALGGCWRGGDAMQFYLLNADVTATGANNSGPMPSTNTVIGLGPVRIPDYLNRPQMVLGVGEYRYQLDEQHRWAERLDQNISRALLQSLSGQLRPARIVRHPWPLRQSVDYQTSIDILELHRDASGQSRMSAQWLVRNREGMLTARQFDCSLPVPKDDIEALVNAQSECLSRLSSDIAGALRQLIAANLRDVSQMNRK